MLSATSLRIAGRSLGEVNRWVVSSGRGAGEWDSQFEDDGGGAGEDIVRRQAAAAADAVEEPDRE